MNILDSLIARPRRTATVTFPFDPTVADELSEARTALFMAIGEEQIDAAQAKVTDLEAALVLVSFRLRGIGAEAVDALMEAHPSTKEQKDRARLLGRARPTVDHPALAAALLAACCVHVSMSDRDEVLTELTPADAAAIIERLSLEDRTTLHGECLRLDSEATIVDGA